MADDEPDVWWVIGPRDDDGHADDVLEVWVHAGEQDHKFNMTRAQAGRFAVPLRMLAGEPSVAKRCAPLVEALEAIRGQWSIGAALGIAERALAAYHAAQGAGRGTDVQPSLERTDRPALTFPRKEQT